MKNQFNSQTIVLLATTNKFQTDNPNLIATQKWVDRMKPFNELVRLNTLAITQTTIFKEDKEVPIIDNTRCPYCGM